MYPGFANFIDEWSQCDFCFTNFGVILEYLEYHNEKTSFIPYSLVSFSHSYTVIESTNSSPNLNHDPNKQQHVRMPKTM